MSKNLRFKMTAIALALSLNSVPTHATNKSPCAGRVVDGVCDVTFAVSANFSTLCIGDFRFGTYTITNNTPVTMALNYIRIQNNGDSFPTSSTAIGTASVNNCGSSLAAGASCNIQINLLANRLLTFNRTLQVGIDSRQVEVDAPPITTTVGNCTPAPGPTPSPTPTPTPTPAPPPVVIPAGANSCTILGASTVTNTGATFVTRVGGLGNVCLSPGSSVTGFPPGVQTGSIEINTAIANTAQADTLTLYNSLNALPCTTTFATNDIGGQTLTQGAGTTGVYCFPTTAAITGTLTLSGTGNFVFKVGSSLTTAAGAPGIPASSIILTNGADAHNVYWDIGTAGSGSATLGTYSVFVGRLISQASNTLNTGATTNGSVSALTAAVTLDTNTVVQPS